MKKWPIVLFLVLFAQAIVFSSVLDSINVTLRFDTTIATIGDRVKLEVELKFPSRVVPMVPALGHAIGDFEILDLNLGKPKKKDNFVYQDIELTVTSFDTGFVKIPPLNILFADNLDSTHVETVRTKECGVNFISVLPPGSKDIKDIKPPFPLPRLIPWDYVLFFALLFAILVTGIFFFRRWKRDKKQLSLFSSGVKLPAHVEAIQALDRLEEDYKKSPGFLCDELSLVLRRYIERRYFVRAPEMTAGELGDVLSNMDIDEMDRERLFHIFSVIDRVRYAGYPIDEAGIRDLIKEARLFVENTRKESLVKIEEG